jgi:WD40 repeat protein
MAAVVGEDAGKCVLLDLATDSISRATMEHAGVGHVALASDGSRLATSGWNSDQVKLWDGRTGQLIEELGVGLMARVFFTPDNREMIVARASEFTFHAVGTGEVTRRLSRSIGMLPGHVAFTADGRLMAMEMAPGFIHLVEVASGRTVARLEDPNGNLSTWMSFSPDGAELLVAARHAGAIHRWDLRAIRVRLKAMKLDWDWPELPAPDSEAPPLADRRRPMRIRTLPAAHPPAMAPSAVP